MACVKKGKLYRGCCLIERRNFPKKGHSCIVQGVSCLEFKTLHPKKSKGNEN